MFVGRDREIESLDLILDAAVSGHGAFRALSGEAGIDYHDHVIASAARPEPATIVR